MRQAFVPILLFSILVGGCAAANKPAPKAEPTPTPQAQTEEAAWDYPDCPRSDCKDPAPGMPNWECADGRRGGPACKKFPDGTCAWVIVQCAPAK